MNERIDQAISDFTMMRSWLSHRLLVRMGFVDSSKKGYLKRCLLAVVITWLPLLLLNALQGLAMGDTVEISFLKDFSTQVRFWVVIPLLIFGERSVDIRMKEVTRQFFKSGILGDSELSSYLKIKDRVQNLSRSLTSVLVILVVVVTSVYFRLKGVRDSDLSIWIFKPGNHNSVLSWAGIFFTAVSIPVLEFLILQWLWRWIVWVYYYLKLAGLPLKLNSAHPDLAGGIGFLGFPPGPFLQVTIASAISFSAAVAQRIFFLHEKLSAYYWTIGAFALFIIVVNVMPLIVFIGPLTAYRRKGFFEFGALINGHHRQFENKWLGKTVTESIVGSPDASTLTDFNSSFDTVRKMRIIPFDIKILASSIIIAFLPLLPLFTFEYNLLDMAKKIMQMLL